MSSGARQILEIAKEVTKGVTPSPFARTSLPFTDTSLDSTTTKEDSTTILASRLAQQGTITSVDHAGDINAEFRFGVFDELIAGAAYNAWAGDTLTFGGDTPQTFSVLRGYTDIDKYYTFRGMHVNTWNLTIDTESIATTSFGLIGMGRDPSDTAPTGVATTPTLPPAFSGISVQDITIDGVTQVGVACVTAFDFTWDNTAQTQRCLGGGLDIGNIIATLADGTGTYTMAWSKNAATDYEKQFINKTVAISVDLKDGIGNEYTLALPKVEIIVTLPSGGNSDILSADFEYRVVEQAPTLTRKAFVAPIP